MKSKCDRRTKFCLLYLLISTSGALAAYITQGTDAATFTVLAMAMFLPPMLGWVGELESHLIERERGGAIVNRDDHCAANKPNYMRKQSYSKSIEYTMPDK